MLKVGQKIKLRGCTSLAMCGKCGSTDCLWDSAIVTVIDVNCRIKIKLNPSEDAFIDNDPKIYSLMKFEEIKARLCE